jgi:hypothetical protein
MLHFLRSFAEISHSYRHGYRCAPPIILRLTTDHGGSGEGRDERVRAIAFDIAIRWKLPPADFFLATRPAVVIARSLATKQSILSLRCEMDCFAALAMTLIGRTVYQLCAATSPARWLPRLRQNNPTGKFSLSPSGKSPLRLPPSCPRGRGVGHRHRTLGWDVVDAAVSGVKFVRRAGFRERTTARRTYDTAAYGKVVWT